MCMSALRHQLFNRVYNLTTHLYCVACKTGYKKSYKHSNGICNFEKTPVVPTGVLKIQIKTKSWFLNFGIHLGFYIHVVNNTFIQVDSIVTCNHRLLSMMLPDLFISNLSLDFLSQILTPPQCFRNGGHEDNFNCGLF